MLMRKQEDPQTHLIEALTEVVQDDTASNNLDHFDSRYLNAQYKRLQNRHILLLIRWNILRWNILKAGNYPRTNHF